jgi:hypothetical protein
MASELRCLAAVASFYKHDVVMEAPRPISVFAFQVVPSDKFASKLTDLEVISERRVLV